MAAKHFTIDNGRPTWTGTWWRVTLECDQVIAAEIADDNPVPADVRAETMRSVVAQIIAGTEQYAPELTELVLAAEHFRKDRANA